MIYFDNAATMPINTKSLETLYSISKDCFGNASTSYSIGVKSKKIITEARVKISKILNCDENDIFFTSGGTEANNIILQTIIRNLDKKIHIICSSIEHESILNVFKHFNSKKVEVSFVKPNRDGVISAEDIENHVRSNTRLICVQLINNELGTIQPIDEISKVSKKYGIHLHIDAVQAVGHIRINLSDLNVDSISASAHKFGGPKGVGFLYSKNHSVGLCFGGGQEKNVKSGTENVPSISAMAVALEESVFDLENKMTHINGLVTFLKKELLTNENIKLNVNNDDYSAILSFRIKGVSNEAMINYLDINGICVSTGSACSGNSFDRSHVLKSIGLNDEEIDSTIRVSLSTNNTIDECKEFIKVLFKGIALLNKKYECI